MACFWQPPVLATEDCGGSGEGFKIYGRLNNGALKFVPATEECTGLTITSVVFSDATEYECSANPGTYIAVGGAPCLEGSVPVDQASIDALIVGVNFTDAGPWTAMDSGGEWRADIGNEFIANGYAIATVNINDGEAIVAGIFLTLWD